MTNGKTTNSMIKKITKTVTISKKEADEAIRNALGIESDFEIIITGYKQETEQSVMRQYADLKNNKLVSEKNGLGWNENVCLTGNKDAIWLISALLSDED